MRSRKWNSMLLVFTLLAGCLSIAPQAAQEDSVEIFPTPEKGITIPARGENGMTLDELVIAFGEASGEYITWSAETDQLMRNVHVGFDRDMAVEPKDLYSVVETILMIDRFMMTDMRRAEPRIMVVTSLDSSARNNVKQNARFVDIEDLQQYAGHPGLLITTALRLPNLDVRTLTNALRSLTTDPNTMSVVPVPESNSVIITGFTDTVLGLSRMLRTMDGFSALRSGPEASAAPGEGS